MKKNCVINEKAYKLFFRFIKEKGIYGKWRKNLKEKDLYAILFTKRHPSQFLNLSFVWTDTEEGWDFWNKVNKEWFKIYKKIWL